MKKAKFGVYVLLQLPWCDPLSLSTYISRCRLIHLDTLRLCLIFSTFFCVHIAFWSVVNCIFSRNPTNESPVGWRISWSVAAIGKNWWKKNFEPGFLWSIVLWNLNPYVALIWTCWRKLLINTKMFTLINLSQEIIVSKWLLEILKKKHKNLNIWFR